VVVIPVVTRPSVRALASDLRAPLTGWDSDFSTLHDWYKET
jgi:hypothetical protein